VLNALEEGARVKEILRQARVNPGPTLCTTQSIEENRQLVEEFRKGSEAAVLARIESKELIVGAELAARLHVTEDVFAMGIENNVRHQRH
jgi:hypothetical protein